MTDTLPCCDQPSATHPWCCVCRCFHHMPARYDAAICQACDALLFKRGVRRCKECSAVKPLRKFQEVKPGTRRRTCIACWKKHMSPAALANRNAWRRRNRDAAAESAYRKAWIAANPEKRRAQQQRYNARHADVIARRQRAWQLRNVEKVRAAQQRYRQRRRFALWFGVMR